MIKLDAKPILEQEGFYEALMINSPVAILILDLSARVVTCNPAFERLFGYSIFEVVGKNIDDLVTTKETSLEARNYTNRLLNQGETIRVTSKRRKKDGSEINVEIQGVPVQVGGRKLGALSLYHDITDRLRAEDNLHNFYRSFVHLMDSIDADVYVADMVTHEILFMNRHMQESFGGNFIGQICWKVFRCDEQPCPHCTNEYLLDKAGNPTGEYVWEGFNPKTGRWYKNSDRAITWEGGRHVRLQIATDITKQKEVEKKLEYLATHDPLTDLPNRALFQDRLAHAIQANSHGPSKIAVLFIDLDGFKDVNDQYGHHAGDLVLKEVARRMRDSLRATDVVARVSGDEFAVILEGINRSGMIETIAIKMLKAISQPMMVERNEIVVTASIGISLCPDDSMIGEELLRHADKAMYKVKKCGKNNFRHTP